MSSSFSLANQKVSVSDNQIKEFFGASQTKDYDLHHCKQEHDEIKQKLQNFGAALKQTHSILQLIPSCMDKLYNSFVELNTVHTYYDCIEFKNELNSVLKLIQNQAEAQLEVFTTFATQLQFEIESIKEEEKAYNQVRQKFDHYKSKVEDLRAEYQIAAEKYSPQEKYVKTAKETLVRNEGKLEKSTSEYTKELNRFKERLTRFKDDFNSLAFTSYECVYIQQIQTIKSMCKLNIDLQRPILDIEKFIKKKNEEEQINFDFGFNKIPIEKCFSKPKVDYFKTFENIFMEQPKKHQNVEKQNVEIPVQKVNQQPFDLLNL